MKKLSLVVLPLAAMVCSAAAAAPKLEADPFAFVGTAAQCGGTAGSNTVTAAWLAGMGLPDDGSAHPSAAKKERHDGLLLNKNSVSVANCAASGAEIKKLKKGTPLTELGFDFRLGGHCGAGAPRFNVTTSAGDFYFVGGCSAGIHSPAPQAPGEWERVRFTTADFFGSPPFVFGTPVDSIVIVYDEGTDTATNDTQGVGLAVIDNIAINGELITEGKHTEPHP